MADVVGLTSYSCQRITPMLAPALARTSRLKILHCGRSSSIHYPAPWLVSCLVATATVQPGGGDGPRCAYLRNEKIRPRFRKPVPRDTELGIETKSNPSPVANRSHANLFRSPRDGDKGGYFFLFELQSPYFYSPLPLPPPASSVCGYQYIDRFCTVANLFCCRSCFFPFDEIQANNPFAD